LPVDELERRGLQAVETAAQLLAHAHGTAITAGYDDWPDYLFLARVYHALSRAPACVPALFVPLLLGLFVGDELQLPAAGRRVVAAEGDGAVEDLGLEECLHQLVVGAVAQRLCLVADGGGVLGGV
jgi:hypothetical protein